MDGVINMKSSEYTIRVFFALVAIQLVSLYVDAFSVFSHLDEDKRYVIHVLSRFLVPVAYGVGAILYLVTLVKGEK